MKKNYLLYVFLSIVLVFTIIDMVTPDKKFSDLENRNLKTKVKFTMKDFLDGTFSKQYEEYINDQFIGRNQWINLKSRSEYILGKVENNGIVYGKDNYFFEKLNDINEDRVEYNIEGINKFIENRKENISFMIIPSSYEVYKDKLPIGAPVVNQEKVIKDIYYKIIGSNKINLLSIMKKNRNEYIYYRTDHHWTTYGAYLGYKEFIESIGGTPIDINKLNKKSIDNFYGSYFSRSKAFNSIADTLDYYEFKDIEMKIEDEVYDNLYDYEYLNTRDKYSMFLRGNNGLTIIKNKRLSNGKKLVIFKDSFGNSMVPFLTMNFEEIHVVDLRAFMINVNTYIGNNDFDEILIMYSLPNFLRETNIVKLKL